MSTPPDNLYFPKWNWLDATPIGYMLLGADPEFTPYSEEGKLRWAVMIKEFQAENTDVVNKSQNNS